MNHTTIKEFLNDCYSRGLSERRVAKYRGILTNISKLLKKDFKKATKQDIKKVVAIIEKSNYKEWTKHDYKVALKKFYQFIKGIEQKGVYPDEVSWISTSIKNGNRAKIPEELLTQEDIKKLIETVTYVRDKAFISLLYESGCRISEVLNLKLKHLTLDKFGAIIIAEGKTGRRRIRLVSSKPYLVRYLNEYPYSKDEPNNYLFVSRQNNKQLSYSIIRKTLQSIVNKAGIKKAINPHIFRHSRASYLANYLTEAQMKQYFGWVQSSEMASIYVHMSGRDVDQALLSKVYGLKEIQEEVEQERILTPQTCKNCGKNEIEATANFCPICSAPLSIKTAIKLDEKRKSTDNLMAQLVKDPEIQAILMKKILEKGLNI